MIFRRSRRHNLGLGKHSGRHLFESLHHLFSTERRGFTIDDKCHGLPREHDVAIHFTHTRNVGQCIVGIVGRINLQEHGHVIYEVSVFGARNDALTHYLYAIQFDGLMLECDTTYISCVEYGIPSLVAYV